MSSPKNRFAEMNWLILDKEPQLEEIAAASYTLPVVIFKHSIRCSLSSVARKRLERSAPVPGIEFFLLDIINHRLLSDKVAMMFGVQHESPQILLIRNGTCIYQDSHYAINMENIRSQAGV